MRASVIIACRDSAATLAAALEAATGQEVDGPYEVIVVDDGSRDASAAIAARYGSHVRVERQARLGPGPARDTGARIARGEVLAFTDADCVPQPGWLAAGLAAIEGADLVQGAVRPDPAAAIGPFDRSLWIDAETGLYETANLFVRRELFERLGGFEVWLEPEVGKALAEDVWLGWRARRAGARTEFCPDALVHHAVFPRDWTEFVAERRRLRYFPAIAAKVPELRAQRFFLGVFATPRSAAFDAALVGMAAAAARRSPLPLLAAVPYLRILARRALPWGRGAPRVAAAETAADAVGLAALIRGSIRRRSVLL